MIGCLRMNYGSFTFCLLAPRVCAAHVCVRVYCLLTSVPCRSLFLVSIVFGFILVEVVFVCLMCRVTVWRCRGKYRK